MDDDLNLELIRRRKMEEMLKQKPSIPNGVITIGSIEKFNEMINIFREHLIVLEFFADWCNPCKSFKPIIEYVQNIYYPKGILFTRIDSDGFPEVSQQFNIMTVPNLLFIKDKKAIHRQSGLMTKTQLIDLIESILRKFFPLSE